MRSQFSLPTYASNQLRGGKRRGAGMAEVAPTNRPMVASPARKQLANVIDARAERARRQAATDQSDHDGPIQAD